MNLPKFHIGPMSKNIVDTITDFNNVSSNSFGLIPSRRQVEFDGGYVNGWTTESFYNYVSGKSLITRDHSGPGQGLVDDDGYESLKYDCKFFDIIHIDPWKAFNDINSGIRKTLEMINFCYNLNNEIYFEVGTEEAIRRFETKDIYYIIQKLKDNLKPKIFNRIKYLVIQSGTSLNGNINTGVYNDNRLKSMIAICKEFKILSKEHNGDYISVELINHKFQIGLDAINIAPEFGLLETQTYLNAIGKNSKIFETFFEICYESKRWVKWVNSDFDTHKNKSQLIKICGHYVLSDDNFLSEIKPFFPEIDNKIKLNVKKKLNELCRLKS